MQALRIDWQLDRPVACRSHEIHLDSLLAWARVQEADGDWTVRHDLPLAVARPRGDDWCFKASVVQFQSLEAARLMHMVRRTDVNQIALDGLDGGLDLRQSTINTGASHLKGFSWYQPTQHCSSAVAWCVGDLERITELLGRVLSLGKLARNNLGQVKSFSVVAAPDGEDDHWLARALPVSFEGTPEMDRANDLGIQFARAQGRAQPPYWSSEKSVVLEPICF